MSVKRIVVYVRVSKVGGRGGEAFHSPADQEQRIRDWAAVHHPGASVIAPHELDASSADAARPVWTSVLDAACRGEYGLVQRTRIEWRGEPADDALRVAA